MEYRDLLKDEIERLGKVLAKVIADFFDRKFEGKSEIAIETAKQQLKTELDIDIDLILQYSENELEKYFSDRKISASHTEKLSDLFVGFETPEHLKKAILLLDLADKLSKTISFERINKKLSIENNIKNK